MPIKSHWRWPVNVKSVQKTEGGWMQTSTIELQAHAFTHVDAPLHFIRNGKAIDEIPLDQLIGRASVIDVSYRGAGEEITFSDLEECGEHVSTDDIALIRTAWDLKHSWEKEEYWTEAPYLTKDAAEWLVERRVKAAGYDFPQDYVIREMLRRTVTAKEHTVHNVLLGNGVLNIEYLINLHQIKEKKVQIFVLPLRLVGVEGAPARVVAVED
jgi:arylformamidase